MGMKERMPTNIFSAIIPSPYALIDDGSDASKWETSITGIGAFDNIVEGDKFGYYGKGIRFTLNAGMAKQAFAERLCLVRPSMRTYFGTIFRPVTKNPNAWFSWFRFESYFNKPGSTKLWWFAWNVYDWFNPGGFDGGYKLSIEGQGAERIISQWTISTPWPTNLQPWMRIEVIINSTPAVPIIDSIRLNSQSFDGLSESCWDSGEIGPFGIITLGAKRPNSADQCSWDVDQLWISDTENLV